MTARQEGQEERHPDEKPAFDKTKGVYRTSRGASHTFLMHGTPRGILPSSLHHLHSTDMRSNSEKPGGEGEEWPVFQKNLLYALLRIRLLSK